MSSDTKSDLISVRKIPLDCNIIADILATYLRCEPTYEPFILPLFRITELNNIICGKCDDNGDILIIIGSLYSLCMYYAISPEFPEEYLRTSISILMSIITECIAILELSKKCSCSHPIETIEYQRYNFSSTDLLYDTFRYSFEFSREIIRDITRCVRLARDKKSNKLPNESIQPYIILFMCTFAITHVAAVLCSQNKLDLIPGIKELLLLLMTIKLGLKEINTENCKLGSNCPTPDEKEKGAKLLIKGYYLLRSFELTSRLCCVISQLILDKSQLYELSILYKKFEQNTDNSAVLYAKLQADEYNEFLKSKNRFQDKITTVLLLENSGQSQQVNMLGIKPKQKIPLPRGFNTNILFSCGGSYSVELSEVENAIRKNDHNRKEELRNEKERERAEAMVNFYYNFLFYYCN